MSRIGKKPIEIPSGVEVKVERSKVIVKGPKGELQKEFRPELKIEVKENKIFVTPQIGTKPRNTTSDTLGAKSSKASVGIRDKETNALWGLTRALIANMVKGVTEGFEKKLEIEGIGFKAQMSGNDLELFVGFVNSIKIKAPENIKFSVEKNIITVSGSDLEKVSQVAAKIRKVKPPEPYKGKGIRYLGEQVRRKLGKKAVTTTG